MNVLCRRPALAGLLWLSVAFGALLLSSTALAAAPVVHSEGVSNIKAGEARLEGSLDPEGELSECHFQYGETAVSENEVGCEPELLKGFGEQGVAANVGGLSSDRAYVYRVVAKNGLGEEGFGPEEHFETALPPATPEKAEATGVSATEEVLHGILNPGGKRAKEPGSDEFFYRQSATECRGEQSVGASTTPGLLENEPAEATVTGLLPNTEYAFCLLVRNEAGEETQGPTETFTTGTQAPSVVSTTLSHVGSTGVTVEGQINPGGLETSYSVQYGTSTAYRVQTTPVSISPSTSSATVSVTVPLSELQANTAYHLQLVVRNTKGEAFGGDEAFTTYSEGTSGLPDGRVYEMVTPPDNVNADVYELGGGLFATNRPFQVAADGDAVAYVAAPTTGGNGSFGNGNGGDEYLASRSPQGGWTQANITPAGSSPEASYQAFSNDLSVGFLSTTVDPPFVATTALPELSSFAASKASYPVLYSHAFDESLYRPLFTSKPPYRVGHVEKESEELGDGGGLFGASFDHSISNHAPLYAGSSANLEDRLFEANDALLGGEDPPQLENELDSNVKKEVEELAENLKIKGELRKFSGAAREKKAEEARTLETLDERNELYESIDDRLSLVNVLPNGTLAPGATFGGQQAIFINGNGAGDEQPDFSHDISADGSRVFWTALENTVGVEPQVGGHLTVEQRPGVVYAREDGTHTVQVSQGPAEFWTASPDGKYAFYTEAGGLWRFDVEDGTRVELAGEGVNPGEEAGAQAVVGVNEAGEDGAYVYFVANGVLTNNPNSQGVTATKRACEPSYLSAPAGPPREHAETNPEPGEPYYEELHGRLPAGYGCNLYVLHGGETKFIATLSATDGGDWVQQVGGRVSNVTPDGQTLVFSAVENLTGTPHPSERAGGVYVYNAGEASLFCASCRPQASGGHLPTSASLVYTYRRVSEDGDQVFFDSEAPLVSRDVNGAQDVYEWERDGSGGCTEADGCVYLLSGGVEGPAFLVDASTSGNDVFFIARQKLVPEDGNENANLYDARVDGALPIAPPECSGTGCQGVPAPAPTFATPPSVTFSGVGNFPALAPAVVVKAKKKALKCAKGKKPSHGKCVKRKKTKKKAKAKRSTNGKGSK